MRALEFLPEGRVPRAIEEFLDSLVASDCGVEEIGSYRVHFEGFTSDCKSSSDYRRNPEAVYQQVYQDFIQREGGARPLVQDMVGDEQFPILYSIFRRKRTVTENKQATAKQVLAYINQTHHEPMTAKLTTAVQAHPKWELQQVPLRNLNIPDQDYEDPEQEPESDPYGRVMAVDPDHANEYSTQVIDQHPIVIDDQGYIIDGNHRAWAAAELMNRDSIQAWVPVTQDMAEGKITLSTDPNWYGAEVDDYKATGPVVNIPANRLVGFEPDDKMNQPASKANVEKIVAGLKQGTKLPPLLVRKYKNGYQVLDGHHRFWAYKLLGVKNIPAQIVPAEDIEEKGQQDMAENFADGKVKGKSRPGRVKRSGASCNGSVTDLRARAKRASGEKAKMYHWCANMKSGKKK